MNVQNSASITVVSAEQAPDLSSQNTNSSATEQASDTNRNMPRSFSSEALNAGEQQSTATSRASQSAPLQSRSLTPATDQSVLPDFQTERYSGTAKVLVALNVLQNAESQASQTKRRNSSSRADERFNVVRDVSPVITEKPVADKWWLNLRGSSSRANPEFNVSRDFSLESSPHKISLSEWLEARKHRRSSRTDERFNINKISELLADQPKVEAEAEIARYIPGVGYSGKR